MKAVLKRLKQNIKGEKFMKIKKLTSIILAAMLTATAVPFNEVSVPYNSFPSYAVDAEANEIVAEGTCGENLTWTLYDDGYIYIDGEGAMDNWASADDVPWAEYRDQIKRIRAPKEVKNVGDYAFYDCVNLEYAFCATIVGEHAYENCKNITNYYLYEAPIEIKDYAFYGCDKLNRVTINNSFCVIADSEFVFPDDFKIKCYENSPAHDYAVKYGKEVDLIVYSIASGVCGQNLTWSFDSDNCLRVSGTGKMTNWKSSDEVPWAEYADQIQEIVLQVYDIENIGDYAFSNLKNLTYIPIFGIIGAHAFEGCTNIQGYIGYDNLPVIAVKEDAFKGCNNSLLLFGNPDCYIADTETTIAEGAKIKCFEDSTAHKYALKYGREFELITDKAPVYPENPYVPEESETPDDNNSSENDEQGIAAEGTCGENLTWTLNENGTLTISGEGDMENYYVLVSSEPTDKLTNTPWDDLKSIRKIVIEEGVKSIGNFAFADCQNLKSVTIPDSVTNIGEHAFYRCSTLETVTIPESVTSIGKGAFNSSGISEFEINNPKCVIADSSDVFPENAVILGYEGSTAQKYAEKYNRKFNAIPTTDATGTLNEEFTWELNSEGILYITGFGAMDDYTDSNPWGEYADKITSVYFYGNVTSIGKNAFSHCKNLEFVDIDESIEFIDMDAFSGCNKLDYLNFHGNKKCVIYDNASTIPAHTELIGHFGSPLHEYADTYERSFYWIDGDINEDSSVDASDASMVLDEYSNIQTGGKAKLSSIETTTADVTNDNVVDAADSSAILQYYAKASTGQNPTWD